MAQLEHVRFRTGGSGDAAAIAALHADSWRRHYRGIYSDFFLDGDLEQERRSVWSERLTAATSESCHTVVAEVAGGDGLQAPHGLAGPERAAAGRPDLLKVTNHGAWLNNASRMRDLMRLGAIWPLYIAPSYVLAFTSRPPVADGPGVSVVAASMIGAGSEERRGDMDARRH